MSRLINDVDFVISAVRASQYPMPRGVDFAFCGRSNVGKSSLLNAITRNRKLAKISSAPGKTRLVNFFLVNQKAAAPAFHLVDLPGYGFAKAPKKERESWKKVVEEYFRERTAPVFVFHLVDIRHDLSPLDLQFRDWVKHWEHPCCVIATKADKLSGGAGRKSIANLRQKLSLSDDELIIPVSASKGTGVGDLVKTIQEVMKNGDEDH